MGCLEKLKGCSVVGVSRDTRFIGLWKFRYVCKTSSNLCLREYVFDLR